MRIAEIEVDGIRALGQRTFSFARASTIADIVAITGPPASGKTTLLQTIIAAKEDVGSYGTPPESQWLLEAGTDAAKIRVDWQLSAPEQERFGRSDDRISCETLIAGAFKPPPHDDAIEALLTEYIPDPEHGKVEYFHAKRNMSLGDVVDVSKSAGDTFDRRLRLTEDNAKYNGLVRFIVSAGLGLAPRPGGKASPPGRVTHAFGALCSTKRVGGIYQEGDAMLPGFVDARDVVFGLGQLTDSECDALLFATTFVRAGLVDNVPGAVIVIDTPERFLGDRAGAFVTALHGLGPNNQIIVATTSRAVSDIANVTVTLG